jgi:hypothetical protein
MSVSAAEPTSMRLDRPAYRRLVWALVISLVVHGLGYGGYELGRKYEIWDKIHLPSWMGKKPTELSEELKKAIVKAQQEEEVPLTFIEVPPQIAAAEPPPIAKFYSDKNSLAANPKPDKETGVPKISGKQTEMLRTETVVKSQLDKTQPAVAQAPQDQPDLHARPRTAAPPGDLVMAKPEMNPRQDTGTEEVSRPRTIKEALARQNRNQLVGEQMQTEGGVDRIRIDPGFDVKATPFGAYDEALILAVQDRWYALLENTGYDYHGHGKVTVEFKLNYDGRITDAKVVDSTVDEMLSVLCQKAINDPSPFDKWPREMRLKINKDYRDMHFTFFYL